MNATREPIDTDYPLTIEDTINGRTWQIPQGCTRGELIESLLKGCVRSLRQYDDKAAIFVEEGLAVCVLITDEAVTMRYYADGDEELARVQLAELLGRAPT